MAMLRRLALLGCTVLAACRTAVPPSQVVPVPEDTRDVLVLMRVYDEAWRRRDTAAVARLLAQEFVYTSSRGGVSPRQQHLAVAVAPEYHLKDDERSEVVVHRQGATAVVSSRWRGRGTWRGQQFVDDERCSLVIAYVSEGWRILAEHCSAMPSS